MNVTRRRLVTGSVASLSLALAGFGARAQSPTTLKISHQFPGGTIDQGDFRDRLCRRFGQEVEKRTNGALKFEIYPNSSLVKVNTQFSAMRRGALDLSLVPLSYSGGEVAETNIGLLPALVPSYEVGSKWKNAEVGKLLSQILAEKGIIVVSWIWQAGGVASRGKPLVQPEDAKGMKVRGGSREMDMLFKDAGSSVVSLPSNEIYAAMQTGAMDAALTSSTSLISFRLEEDSKFLTSRDRWPRLYDTEAGQSRSPAQGARFWAVQFARFNPLMLYSWERGEFLLDLTTNKRVMALSTLKGSAAK